MPSLVGAPGASRSIAEIIDDLRNRFQLNLTSPSFVEVAATMMPRRMTGIKHTLRPACKFLPVPMSLGWQDNPIDDDYPQQQLVPGLEITDIGSGATRAVAAPWMHALYAMTSEERPSGVTIIRLREAQFSQSFSWQHIAAICVLLAQAGLGFWGSSHQGIREGTLVLFGAFLQVLEGFYAWAFPVYEEPRRVKKARVYVLHKGMTTQHILAISWHNPSLKNDNNKPYFNLEDAAVPFKVTRTPFGQKLEATFRKFLQWCNVGLVAACVLSPSNGFLIPLTLLIGTAASEIIMMFQAPFPRILSKASLRTRRSTLDKILAVCRDSGQYSTGFVEQLLPDWHGQHVDFDYVRHVVDGDPLLAGPDPLHRYADAILSESVSGRETLRSDRRALKNDVIERFTVRTRARPRPLATVLRDSGSGGLRP